VFNSFSKLFLFGSLSFSMTACVSKQNGHYPTKYSYHPYSEPKAQAHQNRQKSPIPNAIVSDRKAVVSYPEVPIQRQIGENPFSTLEESATQKRVSFNESDFYPSNIPAKRSLQKEY